MLMCIKTAIRCSVEQFATYLQQSRIKFTWGAKDGSGELYITTLPDFLNNWVAAEQYEVKSATFNKFQGSGNSLNNLKKLIRVLILLNFIIQEKS